MNRQEHPVLSSWNGLADLPHAVERLRALGAPESRVRLLPVVGHFAQPELLPGPLPSADMAECAPEAPPIRLGINVCRSARLEAVQRLPEAVTVAEGETGATAGHDPVARLADGLRALYPELGTPETGAVPPSDTLLVVQGRRFVEAHNRGGLTGGDSAEPLEGDADPAQEFAERIFTRLFLALAAADRLEGSESDLSLEPGARDLGIALDARSTPAEVAHWVACYPHLPVEPALFIDGEGAPPAPDRWTERDPDLLALHAAVVGRCRIQGGSISSEEMLTLVRRHLRDFVPCYPHQRARLGGMTLNGLLLRLLTDWVDRDGFLGLTAERLSLFTVEERAMLYALLLARPALTDTGPLFILAVRLLVSPAISVVQNRYPLCCPTLGTLAAQLGRTQTLAATGRILGPEIRVRVPLDRLRCSDSEAIEARLELLGSLFLPASLAFRVEWEVEWAALGTSAYLAHEPAPLGWNPLSEPAREL